jgi:hypothetical protein
MSGIGLMLLGSSGGIGQQDFTTAGTFTWVVPAGVTSCSVVCVGAGGGGGAVNKVAGGGGALAYVNNISLTPGESMTVVVGNGGARGTGTSEPDNFGSSGGLSSFARSSTILVQANGGNGQLSGSTTGGTVGVGTGGSGGQGLYGGGGAGGYSGNGGNGSATSGGNGSAGSGGGAGGAADSQDQYVALQQTYSPPNSGPFGSTTQYLVIRCGTGSGGGVGILGSGSNGAAGVSGTLSGGGGGGGSSGSNGATSTTSGIGNGGVYGGGGAARYEQYFVYEDNTGTEVGVDQYTSAGSFGSSGAVRIIFPASGAVTREFPSTNTGNL